jgi:hypothetical protein
VEIAVRLSPPPTELKILNPTFPELRKFFEIGLLETDSNLNHSVGPKAIG